MALGRYLYLWSQEARVSSIDFVEQRSFFFCHLVKRGSWFLSFTTDSVMLCSCGTLLDPLPVTFADVFSPHQDTHAHVLVVEEKITPWDIFLNPKQQTLFHSTAQGV